MKAYSWIILLGLLLTSSARATPDGFIWLDVSVKLVVNPATGQPPAGTDDDNFRQVFVLVNRWLANTWRGYRFRLVNLDSNQNFKRIGGLNDTTGPSKWYDIDLKVGAANLDFENAATANPTLYGWSSTAVNLYINNGGYSSAQFPSSNRGLVISSYALISDDSSPEFYKTNNYKIAGNLLHELGHYYELYHTWGDDIADTAPDVTEGGGRNETTVRDGIAAVAYGGLTYADLNQEQKRLVDNTANNALSYYQLFYDDPAQGKTLTDAERFGPDRFLFTEDQMDKFSDNANVQRGFTASGDTLFVDASVSATGSGSSVSPHKTLASGVNAASPSGNDIVLLRPGTYSAAILTKPLTIRATRGGHTIIQIP